MVSVDRLTTGYVGLSTDEKPTVALRNGDTFVEMDTNKLFAWDEDGGQWLEQVSAGGGGNSGGSDSSERMIVNVETQDMVNFTADKTYDDIKDASDAGIEVVAKFYFAQTEAAIWIPLLLVNPTYATFLAQDIYSITNSTATMMMYRATFHEDGGIHMQQLTYTATLVSG